MNDKGLGECPFCYEQNDLHIEDKDTMAGKIKWYIYCGLCYARGSLEDTREEALRVWNKADSSSNHE